MTATEKRAAVVAAYKTILGRNIYSQHAAKRECCFTPYSDGKYYSDCSSSIRLAYKKANIGLNNIGGNTVGMYQNKAAVKVECAIKNGVPTDVAKLRVGDLLLFAGNDKSRAYADYVGHVEMIYAISGSKVTLCGHGSGNPRTKEMVAYCKNRQSTSANTAKGNRGLLKVVRLIQGETQNIVPANPMTQPPAQGSASTGAEPKIKIVGCTTCNIRTGPGTQFDAVSTAKASAVFGTCATDGWTPVVAEGRVLWVSTKYTEVV